MVTALSPIAASLDKKLSKIKIQDLVFKTSPEHTFW